MRLKLFIVGVRRRSSGSKFKTAGPAYEKARSPNFVRVLSVVERSLSYQQNAIQDVTSEQLQYSRVR